MDPQVSRRDFLKLLLTFSAFPFVKKPLMGVEKTISLQENGKTPNVLILVFDTLSAKHISLYGYSRETTPNLARFAKKATVYHAHYAAGNFTTPGTSSLITGTYPWSHRAFHIRGSVEKSYVRKSLFASFDPLVYQRIAFTHNPLVSMLLHQFRADLDLFKKTRELSLLSDQFSDLIFQNDYDVVYPAENRLIRPSFWEFQPSSLFLSLVDEVRRSVMKKKLTQEYSQLFPRGVPNHQGFQFFLLEDAIDWVKSFLSSTSTPFLAYVHLWPPHHPYNPRREFIDIFNDDWKPVPKKPHFFSQGFRDAPLNQWRREYDEYLAYVDAEFGRLFDFLQRTGVLENTCVIMTSDHGEMFERGIFQHLTPTLYEPIIRVPLLISKPGQLQQEDVYTPTSCIDLMPTLLQLTGQTIPDWCEGQLLPGFGGNGSENGRDIFAVEAKSNRKEAPLTKGTIALIKGRYKLIHYFGYEGYEREFELYDLHNDPEELEDLYTSQKRIADELQNRLEDKLFEVNQPYLS